MKGRVSPDKAQDVDLPKMFFSLFWLAQSLKGLILYWSIDVKEPQKIPHQKYRSTFDVRLLFCWCAGPGLDDSRVPQPQLAWLSALLSTLVSFLAKASSLLLMKWWHFNNITLPCHFVTILPHLHNFLNLDLHVNIGRRNLVFFLILFNLHYDAAIKEFLYLLEGIWFVIKKGRKTII